jgi:hypothetical protein
VQLSEHILTYLLVSAAIFSNKIALEYRIKSWSSDTDIFLLRDGLQEIVSYKNHGYFRLRKNLHCYCFRRSNHRHNYKINKNKYINI